MQYLKQKISLIAFDCIHKNYVKFDEKKLLLVNNICEYNELCAIFGVTYSEKEENIFYDLMLKLRNYVKKYEITGIVIKSELMNNFIFSRPIYYPNYLFYKGDINRLSDKLKIAVVGTRDISKYGKQTTKKLFGYLDDIDCSIVSGLAIGTDTVAFENALKIGKKCIAVLPTPFSKISPVSNKELLSDILKNDGLAITEYFSIDRIFKNNFVQRNKIIDSITETTIAVEFGKKSGTMHQINNTYKSKKHLGIIKPSIEHSPQEYIEGYNYVKENYNVTLLDSRDSVYNYIEKIVNLRENSLSKDEKQINLDI